MTASRSLPRTRFLAWTIVITAVLACSEDSTQPHVNQTPVAAGQIPEQSIDLRDTVELDLSQYFSDPDGDELSYSAEDSPSGIVTISVVDSTLRMRAVRVGTTSIAVTATDSAGLAASLSFSTVVELPAGDRGVLFAFYKATEGDRWYTRDNWLTRAPLGDWYGIDTNPENRVSVLDLSYNDLRGELPPELVSLSELERFSIRWNYVNGPIPEDIGQLTKLTSLNFAWSGITGSIPPGIGDLAQLRFLSFEWAGYVEGPIPASLGNLANLEELNLYRTARLNRPGLTGPIPRELGNLAKLRSLDLGANDLTGSIPPELGNLASVETLSLLENRLSGEVPPELGRLTRLHQLYLAGNPQLRGELPPELTALRLLRTFAVGETGLCAPADTAFTNWLDGIDNRRVKRCGDDEDAYLTQAVQSIPYPVPLVAGDSALLRVFVTARRANSAHVPPVKATFYDATGAPVRVVDVPGLASVIPTRVNEGNLGTSSNAVIPASVVQRGVEMVIEVDPDGTLDPDLGVQERIPAEGRLTLDVVEMPTFDFTVIPMLWADGPDSTILELTDGMTAEDTLLWRVRDLLPVGDMEVTVHDPVVTSSNSANALLAEGRRIRTAEGGTGHYMGMMMEASLGGNTIGIAELPGRVAFSIPEGMTIDHELGHNFNLSHADRCGAGAGDPAYPSSAGDIVAWGYDFNVQELVDPKQPDLMTYCEPHWVSDYHFTNALRYRVDNEGMATRVMSPMRVLLLSGGVDAQGVPALDPAIVIDAPPSLPESGGRHRITGRAADGTELFALQFDMPVIADGDGSSSFTFAIPVRDEWAGTLASITLSSGGRSDTIDRDTDRSMAILRDPATGQIRQIVAELPPGPMGREAAIALASDTGFEVFFSRGIPALEDWRR